MIEPADLPGVDNGLALRIIGFARTVAPCIQNLPSGGDRDIAIAVLAGVANDAAARGSRVVKGQRVATAAVEYLDVPSMFFEDDRATLRALCSAVSAGVPVGRFPKPGVVGRLWPEDVEG